MVTSYHFHSYINMISQLITLSFQRFFYLTEKVLKGVEGMFDSCEKLDCDLSKWDVSNVTSMETMFYQCVNLNCDLSKWDVSNVTSMVSLIATSLSGNYVVM